MQQQTDVRRKSHDRTIHVTKQGPWEINFPRKSPKNLHARYGLGKIPGCGPGSWRITSHVAPFSDQSRRWCSRLVIRSDFAKPLALGKRNESLAFRVRRGAVRPNPPDWGGTMFHRASTVDLFRSSFCTSGTAPWILKDVSGQSRTDHRPGRASDEDEMVIC